MTDAPTTTRLLADPGLLGLLDEAHVATLGDGAARIISVATPPTNL